MLEGDNIVSAARRAIMRHDYSAVLTIFPILRHLKMNKSEFDSTLQVSISLASLLHHYLHAVIFCRRTCCIKIIFYYIVGVKCILVS